MPYRLRECSILSESFALCECLPKIPSPECSTPMGERIYYHPQTDCFVLSLVHIFVYIYIYIYMCVCVCVCVCVSVYGQHLPPITKTIQVKRTRHAEHCWRSKDELISHVLLWTPTYGRAKAGRPARTYIQQLCDDTGYIPEDLPEAMNDREKWRERVRDIHASGTTWWWWWWWWEFMCFSQKVDMSALNGGSLKLVDKCTCPRRSVSSTESHINMWLA